jgi:integral membrane protein (TIGR01906 family)
MLMFSAVSATKVLVVGMSILIILAIWAWRGKWLEDYLRGIERGGVLVLALIGIIILFVIIAFNYIFVLFHQIFFMSGTWSFLYSDTLIRLFPERFWQDTFLMVGGLSFALGLLSIFMGRKLRQRMATTA